MRIAHFYGHSGANGVTWCIRDAGRLLAERGHEVQVICRTDSALTAHPAHTAYRWLGGLHAPYLRIMLSRLLLAQRIEVLNVHSQRDAGVALQVARALGIPTCYTCHELSETACAYAPLADRAIAVSAGVGQFLQQRYGMQPPVLHIIPNGMDFTALPQADRTALRAQSGFADGEVWVGFFGRIVRNKNVDGLLRAFARAASRAPALRLAIIGSGRKIGQVRKQAHQLHLTERVRFTGWLPRDAAFGLTGALDALALPSHAAEGLSTSLLAAMAMGVPVLATDLPSLAGGPVRDEETGWLCSPNDDSLAEGLLRVAACGAEHRQQIGAEARREIAQNYRIQEVVTRLEAAYLDAIAARAEDRRHVQSGQELYPAGPFPAPVDTRDKPSRAA